MITPEQASSWGTLIGIILLAIRTELRTNTSLAAHKITQAAVATVVVAVNGPLTNSLWATSAALNRVANLTGENEDIVAALAARKRAEDHGAHVAAIEKFKRERDETIKGSKGA